MLPHPQVPLTSRASTWDIGYVNREYSQCPTCPTSLGVTMSAYNHAISVYCSQSPRSRYNASRFSGQESPPSVGAPSPVPNCPEWAYHDPSPPQFTNLGPARDPWLREPRRQSRLRPDPAGDYRTRGISQRTDAGPSNRYGHPSEPAIHPRHYQSDSPDRSRRRRASRDLPGRPRRRHWNESSEAPDYYARHTRRAQSR